MKTRRYRIAVGLDYNPAGGRPPVVSVRGGSDSADEVVKLARRFGVPVVEKPHLAQALGAMGVGEAIPESLFEAVALVLCEIDRQSGAAKTQRLGMP